MVHHENIALLISQGNEKAFTQAYFLLLPRLRPFVLRLTRSDEDTQEIIQDTFATVWKNRAKLQHVDNIEQWVFKVASHLCYNYLRRKLTGQKVYDEISVHTEWFRENTKEKIYSEELAALVEETIEGFSDRRKQVYVMSRVEGMKIDEIAASLDISPNTVKNTLVHTLKQIRQNLKFHGFHISVLFMMMSAIFGDQ